MKKMLVIGVALALSRLVLVGCGKKIECDLCGQEGSGKTVTVFGEDLDVCNDCIDTIQNGFEE